MPIPGTPVNLLSNIDLEQRGNCSHSSRAKRPEVAAAQCVGFDARSVRRSRQAAAWNQCPDYVVNRGHYFGTDYFAEERALTDADKRALIEFLKTL
jgi:hypothetical protein